MKLNPLSNRRFFLLALFLVIAGSVWAAGGGHGGGHSENAVHLPHPLEVYQQEEAAQGIDSLVGVLKHRISKDPFNLIVTSIFLLAILHTFAAGFFRKLAHKVEHDYHEKMKAKRAAAGIPEPDNEDEDTSFWGTILHFFGEVEAIFGIWCIPLVVAILFTYNWDSVMAYVDGTVNYTEPMFVVIIMAMASTRPILKFSELLLGKVAGLGGRSPSAWWLSILIIAPLLGSFITEPAAMTIAALLLAQQFYRFEPSSRFKYATLGLLFVNVSIGGTLTHFAAPPVLMVAEKFEFDIAHMFEHFGIKAVLAILINTVIYFFVFRKEFAVLKNKAAAVADRHEPPVPFWVTAIILGFMGWTVFTLHSPPLFIGGFLVFLAFVEATKTHHDEVSIKGPLLVGFFLAGLVTHGALQQWWIAPVLGTLGELPLFIGATVLTAFNDNAAITFLASQVPDFDHHIAGEAARVLQYAVVAGAVTGGGLTVIANAPNPAGQSILQKYFGESGVSPLGLAMGAIGPTIVVATIFMLWS